MPYKDPQKYKKKQKEWRENNKEYRSIKNKEYRQKNKEEISIKRKKKYQQNKEILSIKRKKRYVEDEEYREKIKKDRRERRKNRSVEEIKRERERRKKYREDNAESLRNMQLKNKFGIDISQYDLLLESQNYKCAICGSTETGAKGKKYFNVDHCHETGKVRGLLCKPCNIMLGEAKDNPTILSKAIDYLKVDNSGLG